VKKQNGGLVVEDVFEAARKAFFSGANGDEAASSRETFTQVKYPTTCRPSTAPATKRRLGALPRTSWRPVKAAGS
jgi:hypothetical protein